MEYLGIKTDVDYGQKIVGNYEFFSNSRLNILKTYGNLLVSSDKFDKKKV